MSHKNKSTAIYGTKAHKNPKQPYSAATIILFKIAPPDVLITANMLKQECCFRIRWLVVARVPGDSPLSPPLLQ